MCFVWFSYRENDDLELRRANLETTQAQIEEEKVRFQGFTPMVCNPEFVTLNHRVGGKFSRACSYGFSPGVRDVKFIPARSILFTFFHLWRCKGLTMPTT